MALTLLVFYQFIDNDGKVFLGEGRLGIQRGEFGYPGGNMGALLGAVGLVKVIER